MFTKRMRFAGGLAAAATAALLLAGCSGSTSSSKGITDPHPTGTIQFWTRSVLAPWAKQVAADFNKSQKALKVQVTSIDDNNIDTKLAATLRTNDVPDVLALDPGDAISYINSGNLLDITKALDADPTLKAAISGPQLDQAKSKGKYYGTPAFLDASILTYNTALFAKAGISGPPANLTDMLADAQKIRALGPKIYGITFGGDCAGCLAFSVLPNFWVDGPLIKGDDLNNQKAGVADNAGLKSTLEFYKTVWEDGLAPKSDQSENGTTWTKDFAVGNIGMAPSGLGTYVNAPAKEKADFAVAPLPTANGGISTYLGGGNFGITAKSKNPAGAWKFIQYALGKSAQETLPETGFAPVRSDLLKDAAFTAKYPYVLPGLKAAQTGFGLKTKYQAPLLNDGAGPWLAMFQKAVFQGDVDGAISAGQTGFQNILSGNGS
ncbi:MAG TPA: sugar ABC transporter substrate-binding protein [Galbitalea sp.]|jgi:multiple sugar transport system substrate-binding protein